VGQRSRSRSRSPASPMTPDALPPDALHAAAPPTRLAPPVNDGPTPAASEEPPTRAAKSLSVVYEARLGSHDEARRFVEAVQAGQVKGIRAAWLVWNARPYAQRGWPTFESCIAREVPSRMLMYPHTGGWLASLPIEKVYDISGVADGRAPTTRPVERVQTRGEVERLIKSEQVEFTATADRDVVVRLYSEGARRIFEALDAAEHAYMDLLGDSPGTIGRKELTLHRHRKTQYRMETDTRMPQSHLMRSQSVNEPRPAREPEAPRRRTI